MRAIFLDACGLDSRQAGAIATVVKSLGHLEALSLQCNNFKEDDLVQLAEAVHEHPSMSELSLAEQKAQIATAAANKLAEAMEATPCLLKLRLGALRDETTKKRVNAATMANGDKFRRKRVEDPKSVEGLGAWKKQLASHHGGKKDIVTKKVGKVEVSESIQQRADIVEDTVSEVMGVVLELADDEQSSGAEALRFGPSAKAGRAPKKVVKVDWEAEAVRLAASEPTLYGAPKGPDGAATSRRNARSAGCASCS